MVACVQHTTIRSWNLTFTGVDGPLPLGDPDIAEVNGVAVVLQLDRPRIGAFGSAAAGLGDDFNVVLNDDAVLADGDPCIPRLLAGGIEPRSREVNVVRLPDQRRKTHVEKRRPLLVQAAA